MGLDINVAQNFLTNWVNRYQDRPECSSNLGFLNFVSYAGRYDEGYALGNFFQNMENALEGGGNGDGIKGNKIDSQNYTQKGGMIYCELEDGSCIRMNTANGKVEEMIKEDVLTELGLDPKDSDEVMFQNGEIIVVTLDLFDSNDDDVYKDWDDPDSTNGVTTKHDEINLNKDNERFAFRDKLDEIGEDADLTSIFSNAVDENGNAIMQDQDGETVGLFQTDENGQQKMATIQHGSAFISYHDGNKWQVVQVTADNYKNYSDFVDQASVEAAEKLVGTEQADPTTGQKYKLTLQFKIENGKVVAFAGKPQDIPSSITAEDEEEMEAKEERIEELNESSERIAGQAAGADEVITGDAHFTLDGRDDDVDLTNLAPNSTVTIANKNSRSGNSTFYIGASIGSKINIHKLGKSDSVILPGKKDDWTMSDMKRDGSGGMFTSTWEITLYNEDLDMYVTLQTTRDKKRAEEVFEDVVEFESD